MTAPSRIERFRASVRRFQLYSGMGIVALAVGQVLGTALVERLAPRLQPLPAAVQGTVLMVVQGGAWCLVILPLQSHLAARMLGLSPWSAALVSAGTALGGMLALLGVAFGLDGLRERVPLLLFQLVLAGLGVVLTARAIQAGNRVREEVDAKARAEAAASAAEVAKVLEGASPEAAQGSAKAE
ncbi:MAG: hypothetical protein FJ086_09675 [Deltaproteobacteria bacterium]|nr:hypothetical protein [Deltaproteobacteria bacterium]